MMFSSRNPPTPKILHIAEDKPHVVALPLDIRLKQNSLVVPEEVEEDPAPAGHIAKEQHHPELSNEKLVDAHVTHLKYLWDKEAKNQSAEEFLQEGLVTPNVHFMWCGDRWFEYRDYLSAMSVLRSIQPDKITIHYEKPPGIDKLFYHQWLDWLKHDYPYLLMEQMSDYLVQFCQVDRSKQLQLILQVFINQNTQSN
jgi:hypothetical protein